MSVLFFGVKPVVLIPRRACQIGNLGGGSFRLHPKGGGGEREVRDKWICGCCTASMWKAPAWTPVNHHFTSRIRTFLCFEWTFTHKHAVFSHVCPRFFFFKFSRTGQHGNPYCYVNVRFERLGLASLSGAACPLGATSRAVRRITGWTVVISRRREPRANKRRQLHSLEGGVVGGGAVVLLILFIYFFVQRFRQRPSTESRGEPRARLAYSPSPRIRIASWIDINCVYFNVSWPFLHDETDTCSLYLWLEFQICNNGWQARHLRSDQLRQDQAEEDWDAGEESPAYKRE